MNAVLFTFSGTGNTLLASAMLEKAFLHFDVKAKTYNIEKVIKEGNLKNLCDVELIGIGYPVYAFNSPKIVLDLVKKLPEANNKPVFIFKTAGEPFYWNNASSQLIIKYLKRKGYMPVFERHLLMPYNIVARYPDALVKQMYLTTDKLCFDMARRIINGERFFPKLSIASRLAAFVFRIQWPGAALNGRLYGIRRSCNACLKCVRGCPVGNIVYKEGRLCFGWKCIMCMRCVMYCPQNAVKFGLLPSLAINKPYDFNGILKNPKIPETYVNESTKGYFGLFKKYFIWANKITAESEENKPAYYL